MGRAKKAVVDAAQTAALLAAVLAEPADDDARAVLADYLIAAGDPRGEFIAIQLELARRGNPTEREDPRTKPLWDRYRALHSRYSGRWLRPVKSITKFWRLRRGFVEWLRVGRVPHETFRSILATEPVTDLAIDTLEGPHLAKLLKAPGIERVTRLAICAFDQNGFRTPRDATFVPQQLQKAVKRLPRITELRIGAACSDRELAALGTLTLPVRHLMFSLRDHTKRAVTRFFASPFARQLEKLEILRTAIGPFADQVIALPNLEAFAATIREVDNAKPLRSRFGKRFATENLPSFDFIWTSVL